MIAVSELIAYSAQDPRFKGVFLSRNFGHQIALTAGLDFAQGEAIVVMDADLQDPPELISDMLRLWCEGYQVVYGQRTERQGETVMKKATAKLFYWLFRKLSGVNIPMNTGDFRLMDRCVVEALKKMPERARFVRGMVAWTGFRQTPLLYERPSRAAGVTKYPWRKMIWFALDAVFSFSLIPMRLSIFAGLGVTILSGFLILRTLYMRLILDVTVPGFAALFVSLLFLLGLILISLGIIGEYVGRIYVEIKNRPLYLVAELLSFDQEKP